MIVDGAIVDDPTRAGDFMRGFDVVASNTVLAWRSVRVAHALGLPNDLADPGAVPSDSG